MSLRARSRGRRPALDLAAGALVYGLALLLAACGGSSEARRPEPPPRQEATRATARFQLLGARGDGWAEPLPILDALRRTGGVLDAHQDAATGKYVVVYDPRRTHVDRLRRRVIEIGRELGEDYEPLFDER